MGEIVREAMTLRGTVPESSSGCGRQPGRGRPASTGRRTAGCASSPPSSSRSSQARLSEHARFLAIAGRGVDLPEDDLAAQLAGATILVTGGTGCIGSALMAQLAAYRPGRLVSVSRGITSGWPRLGDAEFLYADIRDGVLACRLCHRYRA